MSLTSLFDPGWDEALDELAALQRRRAAEFASEARILARLESRTVRGDWQAEAPYDSLLLEVAGTCQIGQQAADSRIDAAVQLVGRLPFLLADLDAGLILLPQARVLIEETLPLSDVVCTEVDARSRTDAQTLAPGPLRRRVRALILTLDAEEAARRAAAARVDRKVTFRPIEDGQSLLLARGPAEQLHALELTLDGQARALRAAGDPRTMDQLRFDLLCAHQSGGTAKPLQALIHVPVATALGISDEPGVLAGYGPLPAALTRELLTDAELRKVCVDSRTGRVVGAENRARPAAGRIERLRTALLDMVERATVVDDTPEPQHDPSAPLARRVRLRVPGCDGIGCSMPASRSELDHKIPWPTGPTSFHNLRPRSQRCHHAKHAGWTVTVDPNGTSHWTSPSRRTYTVPTRDRPPPTIDPDIPLPTTHQVAARDRALLTVPPELAGSDAYPQQQQPDVADAA